ncbi:FMN-binding negative transcriptional regulator [Aurantiacibacter spongiae]|uniref:FMN-binding negative transcriptional regulator n=1 Tax=Aurantiacibacter spongiae TaxID=2488860 RepID=A0A3N5DB77_9SPHN|nr:FMN-binding negative transcriptional regulator [Aurantiacibacter spongiae]RPF71988.1 FMN-binding negative transcriptional regulator [Aurantiacibacter spongiae]
MHPNPHFRSGDAAALDAVARSIGFGMIFLTTPDGPRVAHTPLLLDDDGTIRFHLARANAVTPHLDGARALACINGPDAYVSARWYASPGEVPTWNYVALEYEGPVRRLDDAGLMAVLHDIATREENRVASGGRPWSMDTVAAPVLRGMMRAIAGFALTVEDRRETVKLAQHKSPGEVARLASGVEAEGRHAMARLMREGLPA